MEERATEGFAGIGRFATHVDDEVVRLAGPATPKPASGAPKPVQVHDDGSRKRALVVLGVIGAGVIGIWLLSITGQQSAPPPYYAPTAAASDITSDGASRTPPPQPASTIQEEMPAAGNDIPLTVNQIAYCLAENLRLDGAKAAVDLSNDAQLSYFNSMTAAYNARCGHFQYHQSDMEAAQAYVGARGDALRVEGGARIASVGGTSETPRPEPAPQTDPFTPSQAGQDSSGPSSGSAPADDTNTGGSPPGSAADL